MISTKTRVLLATPLLAVAFLTAACSSGNTDCGTNSCTVTFDRGVDAKASVLGVDAQLVSANDNQAVLKVAGQTLTIPLDGDPQSSGNFDVSVQNITKDQVVVKISLN